MVSDNLVWEPRMMVSEDGCVVALFAFFPWGRPFYFLVVVGEAGLFECRSLAGLTWSTRSYHTSW